ncbi:MAG: NADP-dependent phosphogluconate dehydrogenase [Coriobacteriia bacterium]|nr:NADP-dependent phosphogluconate dehydrogenase [Coriobacteriia bacterium]
MAEVREFAIVGLGRMGSNLSLQALSNGYRVAGYDRRGVSEDLRGAGLTALPKLEGLRGALSSPRVVFLYIPAGPAVDEVLETLEGILEPGDIVLDGGNSYWGDSIRRHERLASLGLRFIDLGTSGGVEGAREGACFMVGGDRDAVEKVAPMLLDLAEPGGYVFAGRPGSGHFVKLVHNGILYGMLESIGEGVALLSKFPEGLDIAGILSCWENGSVIRSFLIEVLRKQYRDMGGDEDVPSYVEDTGEVNWLIGDALHMEVPVPVIAESVMQLFVARDREEHWARAIAMMRHGFGGHPLGPDEHVAGEREHGKVGSYVEVGGH